MAEKRHGEYVPPESEGYFSIIVVEPQAAHGLHEHTVAVQRGYRDEEALIKDLKSYDPQLPELLECLLEGLGMEDKDAQFFAQGFAMTYTALAYQSEIMGGRLPDLDVRVIRGYCAGLDDLEDEVNAYVKDIIDELEEHNQYLVDCWDDYLLSRHDGPTGSQIMALRIGGALMHDCIAQQFNMHQLLASYSDNVN